MVIINIHFSNNNTHLTYKTLKLNVKSKKLNKHKNKNFDLTVLRRGQPYNNKITIYFPTH